MSYKIKNGKVVRRMVAAMPYLKISGTIAGAESWTSQKRSDGDVANCQEGLIRLYHTTTVDRADRIMIDGFRDNATVNKRIFSGTTVYTPRVWFGDVPVLDDELFDGIGLFNFDAERQAFIAVDVCLPVDGIQSSACDSTWPGIQYWAPASIWNGFPRTRFQLDDIIKLRLASDPKLRPMRRWVEERDPRPYGTAFHARVKKILADYQ